MVAEMVSAMERGAPPAAFRIIAMVRLFGLCGAVYILVMPVEIGVAFERYCLAARNKAAVPI